MTDADERWWCPRCDAECNRHRPAPIPDAAPNEYTPTLDWVEAGWIKARKPDGIDSVEAIAEIRRFFAAHDAAVRDAALTEAAAAVAAVTLYTEAHADAAAAIRSLQEGNK